VLLLLLLLLLRLMMMMMMMMMMMIFRIFSLNVEELPLRRRMLPIRERVVSSFLALTK